MKYSIQKMFVLPILGLALGLATAFAASAQDASAKSTPTFLAEGDWRGVDLWVGPSIEDSREPSTPWPGVLFTLLGEGDGVELLGSTLAHRVGVFDALAGLQGPARPVVILWLQDEDAAGTFGGAKGWIRQLEPAGAETALGGDVWIATGPAEELAPKLGAAMDRYLVSTRGTGLPDSLQIALLDLLSAIRVEEMGTRAVIEPIDAFVETLKGLDEWDSLVSATLSPWSEIPPPVQERLRPQVWAFLHYLLLRHEDGAEVLREAVDSVRLSAVFPAALQAALIRPPDKLVNKVVRPYAVKGELEASEPTLDLEPPEPWPFEASADRLLVELGRLQQLRGRSGDASSLFRQAEVLGGSSAGRAAAGLAYHARRLGDHSAAAEAFARAAVADPVSAHWLREQARSILDRTSGEPDHASTTKAIELLRASLDLDPRLGETWTQLAVAYRRPKTDEADWLEWTEAKYERAPEKRQGHVAVPLYALYAAAGRNRDAARLSDRHPELRQLPTFTESGGEIVKVGALGATGVVDVEGAMQLMQEGRYAEALAAFEALRAHSQGVETWNEELEKQIQDLRRVVAHNRFVEAYNEAARLFNEARYREAADLLEPIVGDIQDEARRASAEKLLAQSLEWAEKYGQ